MRLALLLAVALAACASRPAPPPERALFRLEVSGVAAGATAVPFQPGDAAGVTRDAPTSDGASLPAGVRRRSDLAYQTSVRIVRPDGTTLAAPRLTAFAGQRATIQILNQTAYVQDFDVERKDGAAIVDPVIGVLHAGTSIDLVALPAAGTAGEAALGVRVAVSALHRPIPTRSFRLLLTDSSSPVTIQVPRVETVEAVAARRVRLGEETEWARLPDPGGGADLVVLGRVDAERIDGDARAAERAMEEEAPLPSDRSSGVASAEPRPGPFAAASVDLRPLAEAAASGSPQGTLRVTAVRIAAGVPVADAPGAERLGAWSVHTVAADGVRLAQVLHESHVAWFGCDQEQPILLDPVVQTAMSGVDVDGAPGGSVRLRWRTTSVWTPFTTLASSGPPVTIDHAYMSGAACVATAAPGRTVHPMFTLPDGGTAALVVEWTPGQPR